MALFFLGGVGVLNAWQLLSSNKCLIVTAQVKPPDSSLEGSEQCIEFDFEQVEVLNSVQLRHALVTAQHHNYREISVTSQV